MESTDEQLLAAVATGDQDAFSAFYRRHLPAVLAFFRRRVPEPDIAFDLAAETFAAVVLSAGSWRGEAGATGWLYGVARNKLRESLRAGGVEDAARTRLGLERIVVDDGGLDRVEERATAGEFELAAALDSLPKGTRDALLARVVEEQEYDEIAERLVCSEQVVRQRVSRGLRALKTTLEGNR